MKANRLKKLLFAMVMFFTISAIAQPQTSITSSQVKIPALTGNSGKVLTTDGIRTLWGTPVGGTVSLSAVSPIFETAGTFSIQVATTSQSGYLSSGDWNIFNNKAPSTSSITINGIARTYTSSPIFRVGTVKSGTLATNYSPIILGADSIGTGQIYDDGSNGIRVNRYVKNAAHLNNYLDMYYNTGSALISDVQCAMLSPTTQIGSAVDHYLRLEDSGRKIYIRGDELNFYQSANSIGNVFNVTHGSGLNQYKTAAYFYSSLDSTYVGIGKTNPTEALDVVGNIKLSGLTANSLVYSNSDKKLSSASLGAGLTFTNGALSATGTSSTTTVTAGSNITVTGSAPSYTIAVESAFSNSLSALYSKSITINGTTSLSVNNPTFSVGDVSVTATQTLTNKSLTSSTLTGVTTQSATNYNGVVNQYSATAASSSTVDLSAVNGNYIHITGTTTINNFGVVPAGAERVLVFDGSLTLTNSANLILQYGANIVTQVNDVLVIRSEGAGVWRCTNYMESVATGTWSPSWTGFSSNPTTVTAKYILRGNVCTVWYYSSGVGGNSSLTTTTMTLPFAALDLQRSIQSVINNGAVGSGFIQTAANSNILTCYATTAGGAWTASSTKTVYLDGFTYIIAP